MSFDTNADRSHLWRVSQETDTCAELSSEPCSPR